MDNYVFLQIVGANKPSLERLVSITVSPDGKTITFGHGRMRRLIVITIACIMIFFSFLCLWVSIEQYMTMIPVWPIVILLCVYCVREQTRIIMVDMNAGIVCVRGKWQRQSVYPWDNYCGYETLYSVKDFPETFYIKFRRGDKVRKIRFVHLAPLLRRFYPSDYEAILTVWKGIEEEMNSI